MTVAAKRRTLPAASVRNHRLSLLGLGFKVVLFLAFLVLIVALVRMNSSQSLNKEGNRGFGVAKVAFLYLVRSNLPLDFVWHTFFQNAKEGKFSIFIHTKPGFVFDSSTTRSSFFYGRQLERSVKVVWGESTMIEAERLLLAAALADPTNQRFVLLSDSCVPLYNFTYIYNYLMSSPRSFVDIFLDIDKKEGRYNPKMAPAIPKEKWRKGSQWIALIRKHAEVVVADNMVLPVFQKHCRRVMLSDLLKRKLKKGDAQREHDCIPDEHYVQTLFSMNELEDELEKRALTYTSWNQSTNHMDTRTWHPKIFEYADASPQHLTEIKSINHVNYDKEYRTEWCQCNSSLVPCFLFARKFSTGAAIRLLNLGIVGPFDSTSLSTARFVIN